jgi:hypothetical protein
MSEFDEVQTRRYTESLEEHLRALPYTGYVQAMLEICGRLRDAYKEFLSPASQDLMDRSFGTIRAYLSGTRVADDAQALAKQWTELLSNPEEDGPAGWGPVMFTIQLLVGELAGEVKQRDAITWLSPAAKELPDPDAPARVPKLRRLSPYSPPVGREAEQLLVELERIARQADTRSGP